VFLLVIRPAGEFLTITEKAAKRTIAAFSIKKTAALTGGCGLVFFPEL
jgi:hypothetical protein